MARLWRANVGLAEMTSKGQTRAREVEHMRRFAFGERFLAYVSMVNKSRMIKSKETF